MGTPIPKQFWLIQGKPLLYYTLEAFERVPWLTMVVVPVSEDRLLELQALGREWRFTKVGGGVVARPALLQPSNQTAHGAPRRSSLSSEAKRGTAPFTRV